MAGVGPALLEVPAELLQLDDPLVRSRPGADAGARWREGLLEQVSHTVTQCLDGEAAGRRGHRRPLAVPGVGVPVGLNGFRDGGRFTLGGGNARKGVTGDAQHLEQDDREAEQVVVGGADHAAVAGQPLHLRRLVGVDADLAEPGLPTLRDLEAVAVEDVDPAVLRDCQVPLVDVADHVTGVMDDGERPGRVGGSVDEETPVRLGEGLEAQLGAVELEGGTAAGDPRHDEADQLPRRIVQRVCRPGRDLQQRLPGHGGHRSQLACKLGGGGFR